MTSGNFHFADFFPTQAQAEKSKGLNHHILSDSYSSSILQNIIVNHVKF